MVEALMTDYRRARLDSRDRVMLDFAVKLTEAPASVTPADVEALRAVGFDDPAVHDIVQVAALFNYYDRLADGLGIDMEPEWD